jgi:hypothetical protein
MKTINAKGILLLKERKKSTILVFLRTCKYFGRNEKEEHADGDARKAKFCYPRPVANS